MTRIVCSSQHSVDLSDGRSLGPGEIAEDIDVETDEYNKQLVSDGSIYIISLPQPPFAGSSQEVSPK